MGRLTHTVSGSIATVRSPAVAPIESLKVHFSPIQEGTGDPSPSNVRPITGWTGVIATKVRNIWDGRYEKGYINASGQIVSNNDTFVNVGYIDIVPNSKIKFRFTRTNISAANIHLFYYNENKEYITDRWIGPNGDINISANTRYIRFQMDTAYSATYDGKDLSVYYSDEAETISVTFPAVGKNLFNKDAEPYQTGKYITDSVSGIPQYSNNAVYNVYRIPIKPATTYTFGPIKGGSSGSGPIWATMNANGITTRYAFNAGGSEGKYHTFTSYSSDVYLLLSVAVTNDYGYKCDNVLQVEEGSSATEYEAFDNTIYGGYVDLATGDVYKEYKRIIYDGSEDENWGKLTSGSATAFGMYMSASDKEKALYSDISSNYLKTISHNATWGNYDNWISDNVSEIATGIQSITTVSAWKEYLSEHNLVVCYKLKIPLKIATLTPQELATFKGYSNFWSNAGDVYVTYQIVESSEMTKERQKIFAGNAPTIHTASGSVANFNMEPGLNRNLKSCKVGFLPVQEGSGDPFPPINQNGSIVGVNNLHNESELSSFKIHFSPIQAGSGDPSPTNIRPITGWTGVTGYKGGKNLFDITIVINGKTLDGYGNVVTNSSRSVTDFIILKPGTYTISRSLATDYWKMYQYDMNENPVNLILDSAVLYKVFTITELSKIRIAFDYFPTSADEIQLEVGSIATTYEAYSAPTSYPVSWESQGAIYGGYVDLVSGDVVKTYEIVDDLSTLYWRDNGPINNYNIHEYLSTDLVDVIAKTSSSDDQYCIACSKYKAIDRTTQYSNRIINTIASTTGGQIRIYSEGVSTYSTVQEFKESLSGVSLVYQLATPVIVTTLTPTQMALATGKSSYWSNADSVTVGTAGNVRPIKGWGKINAYSSDENLASNISNWSNMQNDNGCWKNTNVDTKQYFHCVVQLFNNSTYIKTVSEKAIKTIGANSMKFSIDVDNCTRIVLKHSGSTRDLSLSIPSNSIFSQGNYTIGFNVVSINSNVIGGLKISDIIMCPTANYNICSITFPIQSKNLCPPLIKGKGVYVNTGTEFSADNIAVSDYIPVNFADNQNYYLSGLLYSYHSFVAAYNINKQYLGRCGGAQRSNLSITDSIFTVDTTQETGDIAFLRVEQYNITNMADINDAKIQLEVGSSATSYEPYNNSIFGGYVDLVTGEVIAEYIKMVCDGSEDEPWNVSLHYGSSDLTRVYINSAYAKSSGNAFFNYCKKSGAQKVWNAWISSTNSNVLMYVPSEINSKASWLEYLSKNPLEIVYELATPQLVTTLTPTQIQALKGTNNILSDANGIIEVKYWSH